MEFCAAAINIKGVIYTAPSTSSINLPIDDLGTLNKNSKL